MSADVDRLARYRGDVATGRVFLYGEQSHRSRRLGSVLRRGSWVHVQRVCADMAARSDALAQVAMAMARSVNLYGTDGEECAHLYESAGRAVREGYDDVVGRAGPDPTRVTRRDFTLAERVQVLAYVKLACAPMDSSSCYGWAAEDLAAECGVTLPPWTRRA